MSAWMLLPFAFGALSFFGVSIFKKIRENKNDAAPQSKDFKPEVKQSQPVSFDVTGLASLDRMLVGPGEVVAFVSGKEKARDRQIKELIGKLTPPECKNPCGEIPLSPHYNLHQFIQNEVSDLNSGIGLVSRFKLRHTPIPGTTTGTVYANTNAVATFVVHSNGNLHFTPIGSQNNSPHWGYCDNDLISLEWSAPPGKDYIVCNYEYVYRQPEEVAQPEGPIDQARWIELKKNLKHKKFSGENTNKDDFFVPENGKNVIRLLPPLNGPFHISRRQHYGQFGSGNATQCGKREENKKWAGNCPICDYYNRLWKDSDESRQRGDLSTEQQLTTKARQLKPVERHYYNVLVNGEVKLFSAGKTVHDQFVRLICGDDQTESFGDISNPVTGRNVTLIKEMRGPFPEYKIIPHRDETPLGTEAEVKSIMEKTYNLEEVAKKWERSPVEMHIALQKMCGNDYVAYHTWKSRNELLRETRRTVKTVESEEEEEEEDFLKALAKM